MYMVICVCMCSYMYTYEWQIKSYIDYEESMDQIYKFHTEVSVKSSLLSLPPMSSRVYHAPSTAIVWLSTLEQSIANQNLADNNHRVALDSTDILRNIQTIPHYCRTNSC